MRNRAMLYDIAAIEGPSTTSWRFLVMFKNLVAMPDRIVQSSRDICCDAREYRTIIVQRRVTSVDIMRRRGCLYHILTCSYVHGLLMLSCHGCPTSYDIVRDRTTILRLESCSDVDFSFSADNHSEVVQLRTTVVRCRTSSMRLSTCL